MFVLMKETLSTPLNLFIAGEIYEVGKATADRWIEKDIAAESASPPAEWAEFYEKRLNEGAGEACIFMPFVGEFGHLIISHIRIVHFHRASHKIVCCRPGERVLFPSADEFFTDWKDPLTDWHRQGTMRDQVMEWPEICAKFPGSKPIHAGGMAMHQELIPIEIEKPIAFNPRKRGLKADVVLGVRHRSVCPERNWNHWQAIADALSAAGHSFAIAGVRETSFDLKGQVCHSGDFEDHTDAAIELMQNCKLFISTDTGTAHLASTVGCRQIVFRDRPQIYRNFIERMERVNAGRVTVLSDAWTKPQRVIDAALDVLGTPRIPTRPSHRPSSSKSPSRSLAA